MESGGIFAGVPLGAVKRARFLDRAGAFFTLAKLVYNNVLYDFTAAGGSGTVVTDAQYLNWRFVAPDGMFDMDALGELTLGGMLEQVADTARQAPVPAWEDFAAWLAQPKTAELIQDVFSQAAYFGTRGVPVRPVPFQAPADFPDFLGWLTVSAGEAAALDGSQFRTESGFDYEVGLYIQQGFRASLRTPRERPDLPDGTEILPGRILYTTNGGMADVPVLLVDRELCPAFAGAYPGYDAIFYAYGETHDTLGMGLTIPQGWYALSAGTMSMAPFDLAASPIVIGEEALAQITPGTVRWDALYPMAEPEITGEPDAAVKFRFQM